MRQGLALVMVVVVGIGIYLLTDEGSEPTTTTLAIAPPTGPAVEPTTSSTSSTPVEPGESTILAALPDGTEFEVRVSPAIDAGLVGIHPGPIIMDIDGEPVVVGDPLIASTASDGPALESFGDGVYSAGAGGYLVQVEFRDHVLAALGEGAEQVIRDAVAVHIRRGYPFLTLGDPFRWGDDDQFPIQMGVEFEEFEVRRGCGELAVACSETGAVQVIPIERLYESSTVWTERAEVYVHSAAPRPVTAPHYLAPGPLSPRLWPDVLWAEGHGMMVWGGAENGERPHLTDGAILDPATGEWRLLPEAPLPPGRTNRAVWVGDRMIVVSPDGTVAYDPGTDTWETIGAGRMPSGWKDHIAATDRHIWVWTDRIYELDLVRGEWTALPEVPFPIGLEHWQRGLRIFNGHLLVVGTRGFCEETSWAVWLDGEWAMVGTSAAICPRQTAPSGDLLLFWSEDETIRTRWVDGRSWSFVGTVPHGLGGTEGAGGAIDLGSGRVLMAQYGEGAIFDGAEWGLVVLPGLGTDWDMVWTGEEVLMWGVPLCCVEDGATVDAWRWAPPTP